MTDFTNVRLRRLTIIMLSLVLTIAGEVLLWYCSGDSNKGGLQIVGSQLLHQNMTALVIRRPLASVSTNNASNNQPVRILLTAYHRSGSSFTGELITSQPNTFYFYEPLIHLVMSSDLNLYGYFRHNGRYCSTVAGTCRHADTSYLGRSGFRDYFNRYNISDSESMDGILYRLIGHIFHCQFNDTETLFDDNVINSRTRLSWHDYIVCRRLRTKSDCLPVVTNECMKSPVRVIKSVRLSLDIVRPLLKRDPALKLIHLFRDPRGIIYSRLVKTRWYPLNITKGNFTPIERHVRLLCSRMLEDVKAGQQLMDLFPNRVKLIRYEDILSDTRSQSIKQFLDMSFDETRVKKNVQSLNEWVAKLNKKVVEIVDSHCSRVNDNLGYIKLDNIKHVKEDRKSFLPFIQALT